MTKTCSLKQKLAYRLQMCWKTVEMMQLALRKTTALMMHLLTITFKLSTMMSKKFAFVSHRNKKSFKYCALLCLSDWSCLHVGRQT